MRPRVRGAIVSPLRHLGTASWCSRRPSEEVWTARAENLTTGRYPEAWSSQTGLPGQGGVRPGRMCEAGTGRRGLYPCSVLRV